jgi:hypothetical protein
VNGGLGTYGWYGDLEAEAGRWVVGGPRRKYAAELTPEALVITNRPEHECRYVLLPPESSRSEVLFEAELRVEGPQGEAAAFMSVSTHEWGGGPLLLSIAPDWVALSSRRPDKKKPVDMTKKRTVAVRHRRGLVEILVDGEVLMCGRCRRHLPIPQDFWGHSPFTRTQFGQVGEKGQSWWSRLRYEVKNATHPDISWSWDAAAGLWPDRYQRERMIQIHGHHPDQKPWPDCGYSSWVRLEDGRIMFVDYTNSGDEPNRAHIVGAHIEPTDIG